MHWIRLEFITFVVSLLLRIAAAAVHDCTIAKLFRRCAAVKKTVFNFHLLRAHFSTNHIDRWCWCWWWCGIDDGCWCNNIQRQQVPHRQYTAQLQCPLLLTHSQHQPRFISTCNDECIVNAADRRGHSDHQNSRRNQNNNRQPTNSISKWNIKSHERNVHPILSNKIKYVKWNYTWITSAH